MEVPAHSETVLHAASKATGQEICRILCKNYPVHTICMFFLNFGDLEPPPEDWEIGHISCIVPLRDAAKAINLTLEMHLSNFLSRNDILFIASDLSDAKYSNPRVRRLLGFEPKDEFERYWRRAA